MCRTVFLLNSKRSDGRIARDLREKWHSLSLKPKPKFTVRNVNPLAFLDLFSFEKTTPIGYLVLSHLFFSHNSTYVPLITILIFSTQWHHAMCHGSHLELKLTELELDTWHLVCHSKMRQVSRPTLVALKNVQISTVPEFDEIRRGS